ncbi:MAG: class I SAM-dependent methyltransferase, partial [Gammaproteobacteria bacterium]|nr:class I SAM-dependent methyltransferase [Gammaproteobacteria bacterium]
MIRPTERFSARADHYRRARPAYPAAALDLLAAHCGLKPGAIVADVGSGTGILTEQLLERGAQVIAVEPNDAMRAAAEEQLGAEARFRSVGASAEATTLPAQSVDLWVAAQAFHWFDAVRARLEALRVLRRGGFAAL